MIMAQGTLRRWAYAVLPLISVRETSARPSNDRRFDAFQGVHCVYAQTVHIWNLRIWADPNPFIDHTADMLGHLTIHSGINRANRLVKENGKAGWCGIG